MMVSLRSATALVLLSGVAGAQTKNTTAAPPACNPGVSASIGKATLFLQQASQALQAKQDASKPLKQAIGVLTTADSKDQADAVGRAYYLGQSYILLLQQPGVQVVGPRSSYGIATDPSATIDLLAAADSAFNKVEAAQPGCATEISQYRQQKPWLDAMNAAIAAVNAQKFDSAEYYAHRALSIDRRAPYGYTILASAAMHRKDDSTAAAMLQKAISAAGSDTLYSDAKLNATYDLANLYSSQYDAATGAAKVALGRKAADAWMAYIPMSGSDANVGNALANAGRILVASKDTAGARKLYAPILANPSKFGDNALLNAGVIATQAGRPDEAATMFAAVLTKNPSQRDALKNLAASYIGSGQSSKVFPYVDKLVTLDPNNPDNWMLYAYAYSGLLKGTKDAKLTKAYTDSLVKYNARADKVQSVVQIREFSYGGQDHNVSLGGTIENKSATPKSYSMQVEFLDASGNVAGTQTVSVGPVAPKSSAPFKATIQNANVVAYRYKPLV